MSPRLAGWPKCQQGSLNRCFRNTNIFEVNMTFLLNLILRHMTMKGILMMIMIMINIIVIIIMMIMISGRRRLAATSSPRCSPALSLTASLSPLEWWPVIHSLPHHCHLFVHFVIRMMTVTLWWPQGHHPKSPGHLFTFSVLCGDRLGRLVLHLHQVFHHDLASATLNSISMMTFFLMYNSFPVLGPGQLFLQSLGSLPLLPHWW